MSADMLPFAQRAPFDAIRQVRDDGSEYWSGRDLMLLLGYEKWERFDGAVDRARAACENAGQDPLRNFPGAGKKVGARGPLQQDVHLTRFGAYLVAMNGDPRKPEVAAAQTYFAVRTREAEVAAPAAVPLQPTTRQIIAALTAAEDRADAEAARREIAEAEVAELQPRAQVADRFLTASRSSRLVGQVAKEIGMGERNLRTFLVQQRLIFSRRLPCDHDSWDFYSGHSAHFEVKEVPVEHAGGIVSSHYTLRVTPRGVELILKRLAAAGALSVTR